MATAKKPSRNPYRAPFSRPLRVYAFDPTVGRNLNNYMTVPVPYETVTPGPVGAKLAVIDYDASNELFYEPVDLDHPSVLMSSGLEPSESDPRFHQQMAQCRRLKTKPPLSRWCEARRNRPPP